MQLVENLNVDIDQIPKNHDITNPPTKTTIIGIDPSINSTGICVNKNNKNVYYNIVSKRTKKLEKFNSKYINKYIKKYINILFYEKNTDKSLNYSEKEVEKAKNILYICNFIKKIIKKHKPTVVIMEGLSYGSNGQLGDLGGLNFSIRMVLLEMGVRFVIVPPTTWKKQQLGIAGAEKDIIVKAWKNIDKNIANIDEIKLDDLADSYFLAHFDYQNPL